MINKINRKEKQQMCFCIILYIHIVMQTSSSCFD